MSKQNSVITRFRKYKEWEPILDRVKTKIHAINDRVKMRLSCIYIILISVRSSHYNEVVVYLYNFNLRQIKSL